MDYDAELMMMKTEEKPVILIPPIKMIIPRRKKTVVVIPERQRVYITADKTTCAECPCFPKEDPYSKTKKRLACQQSPRTLYQLAADVVDGLQYPPAFGWTVDDVADWLGDVVGLPKYRECILDNRIDGMRLLMLEDPSHLPEINIHYFEHIQMITAKVRELYSIEFVKFARSLSTTPRAPLDYCTWFKSRTGPMWGIRQNWTRSGVLRWMKLLMPEPLKLDHWDSVWYQTPDFPKVMIPRLPKVERVSELDNIPRYMPKPLKHEVCDEVLVPRKFKVQSDIPEDQQLIWMQRSIKLKELLADDEVEKKVTSKHTKFIIKEDSRLLPKKIITEGLNGKDLVLARRRMPKQKFMVMT